MGVAGEEEEEVRQKQDCINHQTTQVPVQYRRDVHYLVLPFPRDISIRENDLWEEKEGGREGGSEGGREGGRRETDGDGGKKERKGGRKRKEGNGGWEG